MYADTPVIEPTAANELLPKVDMQTVDTWRGQLVDSFRQAFAEILGVLPNVVAACVVMAGGYFVARVVARGLEALSLAIGLEAAAERSGLAASMRQVGIRRSVSWIVGQMMFWLMMCVCLQAAFSILDLPAVSDAVRDVVAYIPKLLVATVVVVVGLLVATFLRGVVATSADRVGISYAEYLATGCYYVLALMTFITAFDQLGIQFELLKELILIAFAGVVVGLSLAFGLGGREVMAGILAGYYVRQRLQAGDSVSVAGLEGRVREVGPVATVIETQEGGLLNRHSIPNTRMLSDAVR